MEDKAQLESAKARLAAMDGTLKETEQPLRCPSCALPAQGALALAMLRQSSSSVEGLHRAMCAAAHTSAGGLRAARCMQVHPETHRRKGWPSAGGKTVQECSVVVWRHHGPSSSLQPACLLQGSQRQAGGSAARLPAFSLVP